MQRAQTDATGTLQGGGENVHQLQSTCLEQSSQGCKRSKTISIQKRDNRAHGVSDEAAGALCGMGGVGGRHATACSGQACRAAVAAADAERGGRGCVGCLAGGGEGASEACESGEARRAANDARGAVICVCVVGV